MGMKVFSIKNKGGLTGCEFEVKALIFCTNFNIKEVKCLGGIKKQHIAIATIATNEKVYKKYGLCQ